MHPAVARVQDWAVHTSLWRVLQPTNSSASVGLRQFQCVRVMLLEPDLMKIVKRGSKQKCQSFTSYAFEVLKCSPTGLGAGPALPDFHISIPDAEIIR